MAQRSEKDKLWFSMEFLSIAMVGEMTLEYDRSSLGVLSMDIVNLLGVLVHIWTMGPTGG